MFTAPLSCVCEHVNTVHHLCFSAKQNYTVHITARHQNSVFCISIFSYTICILNWQKPFICWFLSTEMFFVSHLWSTLVMLSDYTACVPGTKLLLPATHAIDFLLFFIFCHILSCHVTENKLLCESCDVHCNWMVTSHA